MSFIKNISILTDFSDHECQDLKTLVGDDTKLFTTQAWLDISATLDKPVMACVRQWFCQDSQGEWDQLKSNCIMNLYNQGKSYQDIVESLARLFKCSHTTIGVFWQLFELAQHQGQEKTKSLQIPLIYPTAQDLPDLDEQIRTEFLACLIEICDSINLLLQTGQQQIITVPLKSLPSKTASNDLLADQVASSQQISKSLIAPTPKFFTTAGPVNPDDHYCLPLSDRLNENELRQLVAQKKYFVLHAPRQTGTTSVMLNFARKLNDEGTFNALYVNVEGAQVARGNYEKGLPIIIQQFARLIRIQFPNDVAFHEIFEKQECIGNNPIPAGTLLTALLNRLCMASTKPFVLFIDEIESLVGDTLLSVLRQLRSAYNERPKGFPQSVCLIGVRDVRDYMIYSEEGKEEIRGGSIFNIKAESLRLADFTQEEVANLYMQHTIETKQQFDADAVSYAYDMTLGQPYLVNALAYQVCFKEVTDRTTPITLQHFQVAVRTLIKRREVHIDALIQKLQDPRIINIIDAIIAGNDETAQPLKDEDLLFARDLGFIKENAFEIANPIYQQVFPRALTQSRFEQLDVVWKDSDGKLNMTTLLQAFTTFYRLYAETWIRDCHYLESGAQLLILGFLQRVLNGGGEARPEYALGSKRADIFVKWPVIPRLLDKYDQQQIVVELKVEPNSYIKKNRTPQNIVDEIKKKRDTTTKWFKDALNQTACYMDKCNSIEGHLVVFDRSKEKTWEEKIFKGEGTSEQYGQKHITIWWM